MSKTQPTDPNTVVVSDPEDYNRQQRFKEIHTARQGVAEHVTNIKINPESGATRIEDSARLAYRVTMYVRELEPLMVRADVGDLLKLPESHPFETVFEYAENMGRSPEEDMRPVTESRSLQVFACCNQFLAEVGMDLELNQEDNEATGKYSDLLDD